VKRALVIIFIALLACGCSAHVTPRTAVAAKPDTSRFLIGASASNAAQFQQATGVQPDIVEHYARTGAAFSANFAVGAIPLIQLMPYDVSLASVANGGEDDWLRSYARAVAGYQRPVILGFAPEMNGSWYSWGDTHSSPAEYIAAWRHVVTVFRGQGAMNVTWLWTVNVAIVASGHNPSNGVAAVTPWWPGAAWVDWAGIDGYFYRGPETFGIVFGNTLSQIRALTRKPVLISETAVAPAAGKAAKIPGLFAGAYAAGIVGLVWFDLHGNRDWQLEDDQAALAAFRAAVARYRNPAAPPTRSPTGVGSSPPTAPAGGGSSPPPPPLPDGLGCRHRPADAEHEAAGVDVPGVDVLDRRIGEDVGDQRLSGFRVAHLDGVIGHDAVVAVGPEHHRGPVAEAGGADTVERIGGDRGDAESGGRGHCHGLLPWLAAVMRSSE
jgi:hypothetical protein